MSKEKKETQMLLWEDSPANQCPSQEKEKEQMTTAISGQKCLDSLGRSNPNSLLGRMCKELLISKTAWYSDRCKTTWKVKVSKSNVSLFQLQASVHGIKEKESGLSDAIFPTPTSVQRPNEGNMRLMRKQVLQGQITREEASAMVGKDVFKAHGKVKMYPTPTTQEVEHPKMVLNEKGRRLTKDGKDSHSLNLADTIRMYPTPTVDCEEGGQQSERVERTKSGAFILRKKNKPESTFGAKLSDAMLHLEKKPGGRLNPLFVEFLMGFPMNWTKTEPTESKPSETQSSHKSQESSDSQSKKFYRTPTAMDKGDNSFKYAAKILKGKLNRYQSKQPVQKTLSMDVAMEHLKNNQHLVDVYDEKFKMRPHLPPKDKFLKYLKENLDKKRLVEDNVIKKTTIDHWLRSDHCFAYPTIEYWNMIKPYLKEIKFDKEMTTEIESDWE